MGNVGFVMRDPGYQIPDTGYQDMRYETSNLKCLVELIHVGAWRAMPNDDPIKGHAM